MVDDFTVCVDRIIARAYFERPTETAVQTQSAANVVVVVAEQERNDPGEGVDFDVSDYMNEGEGCSKPAVLCKKVGEIMAVECRICQEEDEVQKMESPCACNGTLKFAHRKCIQRWCNKKGDITCEICNQMFSPNYSFPPARTNPDVMPIDIRRAWGPNIDLRDSHFLALATAEHQFLHSDYEEFAVANTSSVACLRSVALIMLTVWLMHQVLMAIRDSGMVQELSTFFNFQVSVLQLAGFFLPCYVMARSWYIMQSRRRRQAGYNL